MIKREKTEGVRKIQMKSYSKNVKTVKNENRALIFAYLRRGAVSRADISKRSGMSKSAVTMITNALIEEGQIVEIGATDSSMGRKPILLDIVADYRYAAGIALHRDTFYVCLTDLKSEIIAYNSFQTDRWKDPYALLDFAYDTVMSLMREHALPLEKCIGIGVSAPGPLDYVSGKILNPPEFSLFRNVEVGEYLKKKSGLPVMLDNNAVLYAMQEYATQPQSQFRNFMFVSVFGGIGAAVLTEGRVFRGCSGFAGELGHTVTHPDGIPCACGNRGCLERYASMKALKTMFGFDSYERMVDDAYLGDRRSNEILTYIARELSYAIVNAVNLLDLEAVVLYGEFSYRSEKLLKLLYEQVQGRTVFGRTHDVLIRFSEISNDLACTSVCAAIINAYFAQKLDISQETARF